MRILADTGISLLDDFAELGEVQAIPAAQMTAAALADADILLVRSHTRVNEQLLAGSAVRFVGSPTAGYDHLDTAYLRENDIAWACAPGCNAALPCR